MSSRHNKWVAECGIKHTDRLCYEHEVLSKAIDVSMVWDSSNVMNLWAFELLLRRVQLLEFAVSEDPQNPSYDGANHFMGSYDSAGGGYIAPSLQTYVAAELGKSTAILKEKRKARESKLARGRGKGDGKGDKGKTDGKQPGHSTFSFSSTVAPRLLGPRRLHAPRAFSA